MTRLTSWLDPGSAVVLANTDGTGVCTARGTLAGVPVVLYVVEPDRADGGVEGVRCRDIVDAIDVAEREELPVIGLWCLDGPAVTGAEQFGGMMHVYAAMILLSGRAPQLLTVIGPATGGVAACGVLADVTISVGEQGADLDVASEPDARAATARLLPLLAGVASTDSVAERHEDLREMLPACQKKSYDVKPLVRALLDGAEFVELRSTTAPSVVVGLGTLGGRPVGVVANNPHRRWGILDVAAAEKAAWFVRMCDAFSVPLLVVVDVPAFLPGVDEQWGDVLRTGAALLDAFAKTSVPRAALVTRESCQGAYFVAKACSAGATAVYAWTRPEVATAAVDEVIDPRETRMKLANALSHQPLPRVGALR